MEPRPYPQSYLIYCEKHMPLKLKRILENRSKTYAEEIQCFCRSIERLEQHLRQQTKQQPMVLSVDKKRKLELRAQ
jgi:hypothetical protein